MYTERLSSRLVVIFYISKFNLENENEKKEKEKRFISVCSLRCCINLCACNFQNAVFVCFFSLF